MRNVQKEEFTRWGLYGLLPLIGAAVAMWVSPVLLPQYIALDFYQFALIYSGLIVAYLAGFGAGGLVGANGKTAGSTVPSMMIMFAAVVAIVPQGTFFISFPPFWRLALILVLLGILLTRDMSASTGVLPGWYGRLRVRLTLWAGLAIALVMMRLLMWGYA
ncbi:MAG: DUF3429 family protein [Marinicaulis sp.]|nr:DUF3429 family protein [Marinicaulis sp.]